MRRPAPLKAFIAEILPYPGPLTTTATSFKPACKAFLATDSEAKAAAYGVDLRDPLKPEAPALVENRVLPSASVNVISVLLKPAEM